ncbi:MAG: protein kinase [Planctomycetales bacterium]|nr:protein kinase [Planctomycetales bacterium]
MNDPPREIPDAESQLSDLAHEFTQRLRQGESPSVEEYVARHPDLAADIREIFETLTLMESPQASTSLFSSDDYSSWHLGENRLEDFRIVRELGRGGMGVVYEAFQETLGRRVALKVLPKAIVADSRKAERFRREATITAGLHHPNIVPIFEVGEAEGVQYFAMQFIDGQPLSVLLEELQPTSPSPSLANDPTEELSKSSLAPNSTEQPSEPLVLSRMRREACEDSSSRSARFRQIALLGKQVADALAYAHDAGVIHRDIKPSNLLVDSRGTVWVTDFGLAQVAGQDELTSPGDVVGTLRYVPPERFEGHVDPRGDVYSLGVTLYEILTSRPAFAAATRARLMDRILNVSPLAPRRIDPAIPGDLETIVLKAMSREPTHRYPRASALASDLECYLTGRPISARQLSTWEHTWLWCRRNKALAGMTGIAATLLMVVLVLSLVDSVRIRNQLHLTEVAQREAREQLFDALVARAHARWMGGVKIGRRFEALAVVREAVTLARDLKLPDSHFARLRDEAIAAICTPDQEYAQLVDAFPVGSVFIDFDPALNRYARANSDGTVSIHCVDDHHLIGRLPCPGLEFEFANLDAVVFSPDGKYLQHRGTAAGKDTLRIWDVSRPEPKLAFELSERIVGVTSFTPDSKHLGVMLHNASDGDNAAQTSAAKVHIFNLASGSDESAVSEPNQTWRLVFHPTQPQVVVVDPAGMRIVRWDTGDEVARWDRKNAIPHAWSPDGSQVFACDESGSGSEIYRWDVDAQQELASLVRPNTDWLNGIVFNHRGDRFVTRALFRYQLWDFPAGQLIWDISEGGQPTAHFSADDQIYASCNAAYPQVRFLRHADGLELRRIALDSPLNEGSPCAVMSRDGRMLAATSKRGTVLFDLHTFEELAVIPGHRIPLVFEPDGSLLTHAGPPEGVARWPVSPDTSHRIIVGDAIKLNEQPAEADPTFFSGVKQWDASADGRVIVTPWQKDVCNTGAHLFRQDNTDRTEYRAIELGAQYCVNFVSASPDGTYVATGSVSWGVNHDQAADTVTVWDAASGNRIIDLWQGEGFPQFSPDGKWIAVGSSGFPESVRLFRIGSWEQAPSAGPVEGRGCAQVAFDSSSQLMAVQGHRVRLVIPETGREVAWLNIAEETSISPQCFTPDGKLIAFGVHNGSLYVWDIPAIRRQLAELGLDWEDY